MSSIGWVDFSSEDRHRVQQVIALLKEPGTLDELGIGQIRDAISDQLFPGLSTIQTRARYFVAIPVILMDWANLSAAKRRKTPLPIYLQNAEDELARTLKESYYAKGKKPHDVIGHTVVESGGVARRPSSTYWNGLRVFGIVNTSKSLAEFCREWGRGAEDVTAVDAEEGIDDASRHFSDEVRVPKNTKMPWPDGLTLALTRHEANFLSERFCSGKGLQDSVIAQLLNSGLANSALSRQCKTFDAFSVWVARQHQLSSVFKRHVAIARRFSDAIEGAHILYNRMLAEQIKDDVLQKVCGERFDMWTRKVSVMRTDVFTETAFEDWLEIPEKRKVRVNEKTCLFLQEWRDAMLRGRSSAVLEKLVRRQAENNKPERSLLIKGPKGRAKWYGMRELEYRWPTAQRMLSDIIGGQKC